MKILTPEFKLIRWLEGRKTLSLQTRSRFIRNIDSTLRVRDDVFTPEQIDEMFKAGFLLPNRAMLVREIRPFRTMVRFMYQHRTIFTSGSGPDYDYVMSQISTDECLFIPSKRGRYYRSHLTSDVMEIINSTTWMEIFLKAPTLPEWEESSDHLVKEIMNPDGFILLKQWISDLAAGDNPSDLLDLMKSSEVDEVISYEALRIGVRYMTLFVTLNPKSLDLWAGILPHIKNELSRNKSDEPECSPAPSKDKTFEFPFVLYDIKTLLMGTRGEGLRLKANRKIFKKEETHIGQQLIASPESNGLLKTGSENTRIYEAKLWIECLELAEAPLPYKEGREPLS